MQRPVDYRSPGRTVIRLQSGGHIGHKIATPLPEARPAECAMDEELMFADASGFPLRTRRWHERSAPRIDSG